jgi:hypothetical protein
MQYLFPSAANNFYSISDRDTVFSILLLLHLLSRSFYRKYELLFNLKQERKASFPLSSLSDSRSSSNYLQSTWRLLSKAAESYNGMEIASIALLYLCSFQTGP